VPSAEFGIGQSESAKRCARLRYVAQRGEKVPAAQAVAVLCAWRCQRLGKLKNVAPGCATLRELGEMSDGLNWLAFCSMLFRNVPLGWSRRYVESSDGGAAQARQSAKRREKTKGCKRLHLVTSADRTTVQAFAKSLHFLAWGWAAGLEQKAAKNVKAAQFWDLVRHSAFGIRHFPGLALVS
jgi:hypothetical protein